MYNLIFAKNYSSEWAEANLTTAGRLSLSAIDASGVRAALAEGFKGAFDLVLGRPNAKGGGVILPLHTHQLVVTRGDYQASTTFEATITVPEIDQVGEVSVVITKKGIPFNERNNWTISFPVKGTETLDEIATEIVKRINAGSQSHGIVATKGTVSTTAPIELEATEAGVDYAIQGADLLLGVTVTVTSTGVEGFGTLEQIKRIASMAAADAGFEYTFKDGADLLYPEYPFNPLKAEDAEDGGFSVVTIRCGEPRATKTHDEVVYQTVFVVFPTSSAESGDVDNFMTALKAIGRLASEHKLDGGSSSGSSTAQE